jgi:methylamine--corrinoid protein Co-methyltransferase
MGKLLWEAIHRSGTGQIMSEEKFETEFFPTVLEEIRQRHQIEADPDEPIMTDPDVADAVFRAGFDYLLEVGLYCKDTKRIVRFTEEEIREAIATARRTLTFGSGRDAFTISPRAPGDEQHPYTWFPAGALTKNVELYKLHAMTAMQEPTCDGVIPMPLLGVGELKNILDTPTQTVVCQTEARIMNEAASWAGKPGLFFGIPMSAMTPLALMSTFGPGMYTKENCTLPVQLLQDMRINYDRFNLAFYADQHGIEPWMSSSPSLYGYITGPEQGAIEIIAHTLGMLAYSGGSLTQAMCMSIHGTYVGNDISWCNSAAALAAERNLGLPWVCMGSSGTPGSSFSDEAWYETAIAVINACISGMEALWLAGGSTGIECRWAGEIARAAARLSPDEGVSIIKQIRSLEYAPTPPPQPLDKLYDLTTLQPKQDLIDQYRKFTRIFRDFGLDYPTWHEA